MSTVTNKNIVTISDNDISKIFSDSDSCSL